MHYRQIAKNLADRHGHPLYQVVVDVFAIWRNHRLHPTRREPAHSEVVRTECPDRADVINRILHRHT